MTNPEGESIRSAHDLKPSRKLPWMVFVGVGLVLLYFAWPHLSLMLRLALIANENVAVGVPHQDDLESLRAHPPDRLTWYLGFAGNKGRAAICVALESTNVSDSAGVSTALVSLSLEDPDAVVRRAAQRTLSKIYMHDQSEEAIICDLLRRAVPGRDLERVLDAIAQSAGKAFHEYLCQLGESSDVYKKLLALRYLARCFPKDSRVRPLARYVANHSPKTEAQFALSLLQIENAHPGFISELLQGTLLEKWAGIAAIVQYQEHEPSITVISTATLKESRKVASSLVEQCSTEDLNQMMPLLDSCSDVNDLVQWTRLRLDSAPIFLNRILHIIGSRNCRFDSEQSQFLVQCLRENSARTRKAAASILSFGTHPQDIRKQSNPFPPDTGPRNPANTHIFRSLLVDRPGEMDPFALSYFNSIDPFEEEDVDLIATTIRRQIASKPEPGISVFKYSEVQRSYLMLTTRFPDHPSTQELRGLIERQK